MLSSDWISAVCSSDLSQRRLPIPYFLTFLSENVMTEDRARLDALPTAYPRIFSTGPLPWGFEHGDGWSELIAALCATLNEILESEPGASIGVKQVKEKFGTLRFYRTEEHTSELQYIM